MRRYVIRRLLQLVPIILCVTLLSFAMMQAAGSDYVTTMIESQGVAVTQDVIDARRHELGLDQPFLAQYGTWLAGLLTGDLGTSYVSGKDVASEFASRLPATILLTVTSMVATLALAIPLGICAAVTRGRVADYVIRITSFVGNALPNFFVALLLILVFAIQLGWLPVMSGARTGAAGIVLPTATLAIAMASKYTRQVRAVVLDELRRPYVQGARARGVRERTILVRSVLRCGLPMIVTIVALSVGDLLGGTAIVETIFMWNGVGKLAVDAITMRDYPMIQAYVVWMAIIYVGVNLIADLLYHRLDPRVASEVMASERVEP